MSCRNTVANELPVTERVDERTLIQSLLFKDSVVLRNHDTKRSATERGGLVCL
jgi:hypothetical protein